MLRLGIGSCLLVSILMGGCKPSAPASASSGTGVSTPGVPERGMPTATLNVQQGLQDLTDAIGGRETDALLIDRFYPIGFSKDGKFAYIDAPADEAVGQYLWDFVILNLTTDAKVVALSWQDYPEEEQEKTTTLAELLALRDATFREKLGEHHIEAGPRRLMSFPIHHQGDVLRARIQAGPDPTGDSIDRFSDVIVVSKLHGEKKIGTVRTSDPNVAPPIPSVRGLLASPYEPRIVVVTSWERSGWEGPPNVATFALHGAHLEKGFKK